MTAALSDDIPAIRISESRLGGLFRDFTAGLKQQMFYWGRDVVHPSGNLLVAQGFTKTKSAGLQGTSCYRRDWQGGFIELHGACAGWYGNGGGFVFIRPHGRCQAWLDGAPPVPGEWPAERIADPGPAALYERCRPFLDWWLHSDAWTEELLGSSYRIGCHRHFKKLPRSKPWLPPEAGAEWLKRFRDNSSGLDRWKRFELP